MYRRTTASAGIAAAFGVLMSGAAFAGSPAAPAAEPVVASPAPVVVPSVARDWTGFYGGGRFGWGDLGRDASGDGVIGGLYLGYLYDFGGWALGVEGGYDAADIDVEAGGATVGSLDEVWRLGVRGGVTTGDIFAYGTAGVARARVSNIGSENGWYGGLGLEYALDDNWRLGGEVLYHRFDDFGPTAVNVSATTIQARLSYRF
jgi:opacity protein-like surface antigen